jgi:DNA polymerase-3 subunit gamma/tau
LPDPQRRRPGRAGRGRDQYDLGVEPRGPDPRPARGGHGITRAKVGGSQDPAQSAEEREAYADWASRLGHGAIHRLWQLLLKGLARSMARRLPDSSRRKWRPARHHASRSSRSGGGVGGLACGEAVPRRRRRRQAPAAEEQAPLLRLHASFPRFLVQALEKGGKAHIASNCTIALGLVSYGPAAGAFARFSA